LRGLHTAYDLLYAMFAQMCNIIFALHTGFVQSGFVARRKSPELGAKKLSPEIQRIRSEMASRALEIREMVKRMGLAHEEQVIRNKLTGRTAMDPSTLAKINDFLGIRRRGDPAGTSEAPLGDLRLLGGVAAGLGWESFDEENIPVPYSLCGENRVGWIVRGDSMAPWLQEGDIAVFEAFAAPKIGFPNLIRTGENEYRIKMVRHDGTHYRLWSLNPAYDEELATGQWLGYFVGYYRLTGMRVKMEVDPAGLRPDPEFMQKS
jgi:SOS-response transcriptional repressor LexA